jgi:hypothetical protein
MHAQAGLAFRKWIERCVHGAMARSGERMRMRISGAWQCGHLEVRQAALAARQER